MLLALLACRAPDPQVEARLAAAEMDPRFEELVAWTEARMAEWHIPGAAIAIVEDGELRHLAGIGVRQEGYAAPVTPDTLFRAGSISKMFAGALAAEEAVAGRLDLAAPAGDVLGDLALASGSFADFTLLQLLSHQSGMQTIGLPNECDTDPDALAEVFAGLTPEWALWTPPGELYNYANQGYGLAGLAVERSSGARYPDLAQGLLDAAGMTTATYDWEEAAAGDFAMGHTMVLAPDSADYGEVERYRTLDERACVASYPSGGLMASARDLGGLAERLVARGDGWVSPDAWTLMTTQGYNRSETSGYGFGLQATSYRDHPSLTHHGSVGGYLAMVWAVPDAGLGVAVMVNVSHTVTDPPEPWGKPTQRIMRQALDTFLGLEPQEITSSVRPVEEWDRFVGTWHSDYDLGDVTITLDGDELWYTDAERSVVLLPYSRDGFLYAIPDDDGTNDYVGVSFAEGSAEDLTWLLTDGGVARRQ